MVVNPWWERLKILQVIITLSSDLILINVLSVPLEIRPKVLLKRTFKSLAMFCLVTVSLLLRQSLKCLNHKFRSHVNKGVFKIAKPKMSLEKIFCLKLLQRNSLYRAARFENLEGILGFSVPSIILVKAGLMQITM